MYSTFPRLGALLAAAALLLPGSAAGATPKPADWELTWQDEFSGPAGSAPDPGRWRHQVGGDGWGNEELQYYTPGNRNAAHNGQGQLEITARRETPAGSDCWYGQCQYSSARLVTNGTFAQQYGRFEARIKVPRGQGMWPAFWMLGADYDEVGWPYCGEIDVMENVGKEPNTVYGTVHGDGYSDENGIGGSTTSPDGRPLADNFHTYSVEWGPGEINWFVDGRHYHRVTPDDLPSGAPWAFDKPFFMLLNLAVGGVWPGSPDASTRFPQQLVVDHIRVYSWAGGKAPAPAKNRTVSS
ncbi:MULTISPECIES: family 16 glycosylhydrolase [unclassified Crossiella]|uniref:glycoside hydrolase family 16 protein n=1 Tax=unclassified Crossiella TaxID=2620835 RepID=UPI001FFF44FE|nr:MULTISPECIES: glycoside hydrolase family 16 protein [unclassified Crossiella]MCK2244637.1 glycoside hydrolase family 16 protein [Crossiella sp. S99.2]MCK2258376.1 glycoside hydrolase family 16 protein [Crossiella sp. S99.1]